jgi:Zn ribbon nucleic-acid-binding protein
MQNTSDVVLEQTACSKCSSSDAFTIYDDGHCHCFSCGYHMYSNRFIPNNKNNKEEKKYALPSDCSDYIPAVALAWLDKYEISQEDILEHKFKWSDSKELLIFPIYREDYNLVMWQGRYFGQNKRHPKYITRGQRQEVLHILGIDKGNRLVFTEDLISAIKISKIAPAMPLWGSHISATLLSRIYKIFPKTAIWLDSDKYKEAIKFQMIASQFGDCRLMYSTNDPKCYSIYELGGMCHGLFDW